MDLPDASQWDETTCNLAVCPHPQCWATIRRIERGHPRILSAPCKTLEFEDKLPVLTIVNISDSCLQANRYTRSRHHLSRSTFAKAHSLSSRGPKLHSKSRPQKDLPDKGLITRTDRSLKKSQTQMGLIYGSLAWLPVLNLNRTQIPCPQDDRNMVVVWVPEESDKQIIPTKRKHIVPKEFEKERKKSALSSKSSLSRKQYSGKDWRISNLMVPPPTPEHFFEQLTSRSSPRWNQFDLVPQGLLKDLLSDEGKTVTCSELKTQLAMMKKIPPLERSRAGSTKLFLSIHRLTLQRPALRYSGHLKTSHSNLKTEDHWKQQQQHQHQQMQLKELAKKQEDKKKSKLDPGSQATLHEHSDANIGTLEMVQEGHGHVPDWKSDKKQRKQKMKGTTLRQDSTQRMMDCAETYPGSFPEKEEPELSSIEPTNTDISAQMEFVLEVQEKTQVNLSSSVKTADWNPELKLLRILQATDEEGANQTSGEDSEGSLEIQGEVITEQQGDDVMEEQRGSLMEKTEGLMEEQGLDEQKEVLTEEKTEDLPEEQGLSLVKEKTEALMDQEEDLMEQKTEDLPEEQGLGLMEMQEEGLVGEQEQGLTEEPYSVAGCLEAAAQ